MAACKISWQKDNPIREKSMWSRKKARKVCTNKIIYLLISHCFKWIFLYIKRGTVGGFYQGLVDFCVTLPAECAMWGYFLNIISLQAFNLLSIFSNILQFNIQTSLRRSAPAPPWWPWTSPARTSARPPDGQPTKLIFEDVCK